MISNFDHSDLETANKLLQQGKIQEAITEYRHCVKSIPDLSWSHYYLGDILTRLEDWEWAAEAYQQAVALGANYLCYYRLAVALVKLERWDEAVEVLNKGLKLNPSYDKFYLLLGPALIHKQDWQTAIFAYERAIALKPAEPEFNLKLGQLLLQQERFQEALGYLEWSVNFNSDDPQLQFGLGMALVETSNDLNWAEVCLRRSLELQPNQPKGYFYLGKLCRQQGRFYEALGFYRSSWELSQELDCGFALAEVLGQLGRWSEAVEQYRQIIFKFGDSGRALFGLGQALVVLDCPLEAVVEWRRAAGLGWDTLELHSGLAEALVGLGVWDEVVIAWDKLLAVQAGNVGVRRRLALALMGLGQWLDAKSQWQKYLQVAPGGSQGALIDFRPMLGMYGEIPHSESLSIQGDLTVELWLYLRQWPDGWTNIIGKLVNDQQNEFCLRLKNGEEGQWYYGEGDKCVNPLRWIPKDKIPLHQWVHIACVRKVGKYGQLYIDGVLQGERYWGTHLEAMQTEAPVRLMVSSNRQQFLDGMLSDVRVWQVARTGDEIRQSMYERMTARETGLVAVWYGAEEMDLVDIVGKHHGKIMRVLDAGKPRPKVGICAGEFSDNRTERVNTLAQLYGGFAEAELIECLLPQQEEQVWEINIPCYTIRVKDEGQFVEQAVTWVLAHPYEVAHLSHVHMPNIILGLLYKVLWDARVIVDEDELSFLPAEEIVNLEGDLPPQLVDLVAEKWNRLVKILVKGFDGLINLHEVSIGTTEVRDSLVILVTNVLMQPGCDLSDGLVRLLEKLPAVKLLESIQQKNSIQQAKSIEKVKYSKTTSIKIVIPSFNRHFFLKRLLSNIDKEAKNFNISVDVFDDGSQNPIVEKVSDYPNLRSLAIHRYENHGKKNYWQLVDRIFKYLQYQNFNLFIYMPDDIEICSGFFHKSLSQWYGISDNKKIVLNLGLDNRTQCWTNFERIKCQFGKTEVFKTQWVDMLMLFEKSFLDALDYSIKPISLSRWNNNTNMSSGVGQQLSNRLHDLGFSLYQVSQYLISHGDHESMMNPEERKINPLIIIHQDQNNAERNQKIIKDKNITSNMVVAGVASLLERKDALKDTVKSILPQVDQLIVYQNGYKEKFDFLHDQKIEIFSSLDTKIDMGDAGKFYKVHDYQNSYYFSIDDDLIYPSDYVSIMVNSLRKYDNRIIVSCHGRILKPNPKSYYKDFLVAYRCLDDVNSEYFIHFGGTGVMAFHTNTVKINFEYFKTPNMADIWVGLYARENHIPILVVPHKSGWILHSDKFDLNSTIFETHKNKDDVQNALIKNFDASKIIKP